MKTIIAGSRTISHQQTVNVAIELSKFDISEVVSGCAGGVDACGEAWACINKIPIKRFTADWVRYGVSAGPIRNKQMAEYADACIVIWDGKSRGASNMIATARKLGLRFYLYIL